MSSPSIYLTGFMGSGKSTTGRLIAAGLNLPFVDLDDEIVHRHGPIPEIFAARGEPWFRRVEVDVLHVVPRPGVIALGGGAFMTRDVRDFVAATGLAVFLDWPFSVLLERIQGDANRPLARDTNALQALHQRRLPIYRQADLVWSCRAEHAPEQLAAAIVARIGKTGS